MKYYLLLKYFLFLIFVFFLQIAFSQNSDIKLAGSWESYKQETEEGNDGSEITLDGKPFDDGNLTLTFTSDSTVIYARGAYKKEVNYNINGNELYLEDIIYIIESYKKNKLVLLERKDQDLYSLFNIRIYLQEVL